MAYNPERERLGQALYSAHSGQGAAVGLGLAILADAIITASENIAAAMTKPDPTADKHLSFRETE